MRPLTICLLLLCFSGPDGNLAPGSEAGPVHWLAGDYIASLATVQGTDLCLVAVRGKEYKGGAKNLDRLVLLDLGSGRILHAEEFEHASLMCVAVAPDGKLCAYVHGGKITFREVESWQVTADAALEGTNPTAPRGAVFSHDGKLLFLACNNRLVAVSTGGKSVFDVSMPQNDTRQESYIFSLAASPSVVACTRNDGRITLHSPTDGKVLDTYQDFKVEQPLSIAFSPDGTAIAMGGCPGTACVYDAKTGKLLRAMPELSNHVRSVAFSPSAKLLATACRDGKVRVYAMADGKQVFISDLDASLACFKTEDRLILASFNGLRVVSLSPNTSPWAAVLEETRR